MKNRLARTGILGLACLGLLGTISLVAPVSVPQLAPTVAEAAVKAKPAKKHRGITVGNTHVGGWVVPLSATSKETKIGYCFEPDADHPTSAGKAITKNGAISGMTLAQSNDVMYIVQRYGGPKANAVTSAAIVAYAWETQDVPSFRSDLARILRAPQMKEAVKLLAVYRREAKNRGEYDGDGSAAKGYFGQPVDVTFRLKTAYGKPATGKRFTLKGSGISVPKTVTTDRNGVARVKGKPTVAGGRLYTVEAKHVSPASGGVLINQPGPGDQKTVMYTGAKTTVVLKASNRTKKSAGPKFSQECKTDCKGVATIKSSLTGECGASRRAFAYVEGRYTGKSVFVGSCKPGSVTFTAADLSKVSLKTCYVGSNGKCATPQVTVGSFVAECPRWPEVRVSGVLGCKQCSFQASAANPSRRTMVMWQTVDGTRAAKFTLAPGGSKALALDATGRTNGLYFEAKNSKGKTIAKGQLGKPGVVYSFG